MSNPNGYKNEEGEPMTLGNSMVKRKPCEECGPVSADEGHSEVKWSGELREVKLG